MQRLLNLRERIRPTAVVWEINGRQIQEGKQLSEGGFAYVSHAKDVATGELFALKKMLCQDKEGLKTALQEAELLENLPSHKNIVGYHGHIVTHPGDGGCPHKQVLILLEYCPGGTLYDLLTKHDGLVPEDEMLHALTDVAEAIFCLHSHSPPLLHRDLKLENVICGEDGWWKVIDFGSCSDQSYDLTEVAIKELGRLAEEVGRHTTMMYRPPEMVDVYLRYPISTAVDVWMLGCILYCLLFNKQPFEEASALAIREAKYSIPPRRVNPSKKIIDLLVWLLAPDPRHRPAGRKLVTTLWQWQELEELPLPEPVLKHRAKLTVPPAKPQEKKRNSEFNFDPSKASGPPGMDSVENFLAGTDADDGQAAGAAAAAIAEASSAAEPWTASFADFGGTGGFGDAAAAPAAGSDDNWAAFDDFQGSPPSASEAAVPGTEQPAEAAAANSVQTSEAAAAADAPRSDPPSGPSESGQA